MGGSTRTSDESVQRQNWPIWEIMNFQIVRDIHCKIDGHSKPLTGSHMYHTQFHCVYHAFHFACVVNSTYKIYMRDILTYLQRSLQLMLYYLIPIASSRYL